MFVHEGQLHPLDGVTEGPALTSGTRTLVRSSLEILLTRKKQTTPMMWNSSRSVMYVSSLLTTATIGKSCGNCAE
jgi:hypothetical protein